MSYYGLIVTGGVVDDIIGPMRDEASAIATGLALADEYRVADDDYFVLRLTPHTGRLEIIHNIFRDVAEGDRLPCAS